MKLWIDALGHAAGLWLHHLQPGPFAWVCCGHWFPGGDSDRALRTLWHQWQCCWAVGREENLTSLRADMVLLFSEWLNTDEVCSSLKRLCQYMIYNLWAMISALKFTMNTCFCVFYEHIQIGGSHPRWPSHCWDSQLQMRGILAKLERQQNWSHA